MNAITPVAVRSHAAAAATTLRQAIGAGHAPLAAAVSAYRAASAGLRSDADLMDVLRSAGALVLAAEQVTAASKHVEASARTALAQAMSETGCSAVTLADHVVHLGTKPARVDIEDESAIPAALFRTPPPAPDKVAIAKLLRTGGEVPGARLIGNHEPMVVFKGRTS